MKRLSFQHVNISNFKVVKCLLQIQKHLFFWVLCERKTMVLFIYKLYLYSVFGAQEISQTGNPFSFTRIGENESLTAEFHYAVSFVANGLLFLWKYIFTFCTRL